MLCESKVNTEAFVKEVKLRLEFLYKSDKWQNSVTTFENFLSYFKNDLEFLYFIKNSIICDSKIKPEPSISIPRACYYNALSYVKKYDVDLAWGYICHKPSFNISIEKMNSKEMEQYLNLWNTSRITHGFCIKDNKVIDPTIKSNGSCFYVYEIVPKNIWEKFNWKENDHNTDSSDFFDYVYDRIDENKEKCIKWYLKNFV